MKHPYYDTTLADARRGAERLLNGFLPDPQDIEHTDAERLAAVDKERATCGFNWITGKVWSDLLKAAAAGKTELTTEDVST